MKTYFVSFNKGAVKQVIAGNVIDAITEASRLLYNEGIGVSITDCTNVNLKTKKSF